MYKLSAILGKIIVLQFYKDNAGFFLAIFFVMFGIVHPPELLSYHEGLIMGILSSDFAMALVMASWLIYNCKCILFCLRCVRKEASPVMLNLQGLSHGRRFILFLGLQISVYAPVIIYSVFVLLKAYAQNQPAKLWMLIAFNFLMVLLPVLVYLASLNFHVPPISIFTKKLLLRRKIPVRKPFLLYLIYQIMYYEKVALLFTKSITLFLLHTSLVVRPEEFQLRNFIPIFVLVISTHAILVYKSVLFAETKLCFVRNLPISFLKRVLLYVTAYSLLLLPELFILSMYGPGLIPLSALPGFYIIAVGQLLLYTAIAYDAKLKISSYVKVVTAVFFITTMLLLSEFFIVIGLLQVMIALPILSNAYARFELPA